MATNPSRSSSFQARYPRSVSSILDSATDHDLSRGDGSRLLVLRPPAVERPDRQQYRADGDAEDRGVGKNVAGVGEGDQDGHVEGGAGRVPVLRVGRLAAGSAEGRGGLAASRSSRARPQPTTKISANEIPPTPR